MHKCKSLAALFLTVTMILVFAVPVFAAENRASEYIETYKVNIDKSENTVNLRVYISGAIWCFAPKNRRADHCYPRIYKRLLRLENYGYTYVQR